MTNEEVLGWAEYFRRRPPGWREDLRTYYIVSAFAGSDKLKPEDLFESLKVIKSEQGGGGGGGFLETLVRARLEQLNDKSSTSGS